MISATNGKTTTAAMSGLGAERHAGIDARSQPRRREHGRRDRLDAALQCALGAGGSTASSDCSRSTSSGWSGSPRAAPRALLLANLFRDQLDRYGELETIAERWGRRRRASWRPASALVLNADDPLIADLGRERRRRASTSGSRIPRSRCARCSMRPTPSTAVAAARPYVYDAIYLGHLGDLPLPELRCAPSGAGRHRASRSRCTEPAGELHPAHARRGGRSAAAAARPLQRLQRARRRRAVPGAGDRRCADIVAGLERVTAAFGRAESRSRSAAASCRSC